MHVVVDLYQWWMNAVFDKHPGMKHNAYVPAMVMFIVFVPGGLAIWRASKAIDNNRSALAGGTRGATVGIILAVLWPWVIFAVLPVAIVGLLGLLAWSWYDLLPSKEERIERKAAKVAELRARKVELNA